MELAKLQQHFLQVCLQNQPASAELTDYIDNGNFKTKNLLKVYQQSAQGNISQALSLTYPVINKLLGNDFFHALTIKFMQKYPPVCSNMDDYGADFSRFLAEFEHTKSYLYLPDVALLEWQFHLSTIADETNTNDWQSITNKNMEQLANCTFGLSPSAKLMVANYPVDEIWQINQDGIADDLLKKSIDVSKSMEVFLLLLRQQMKVTIYRLSAVEYQLLTLLLAGNNLHDVLAKLAENTPIESLAELTKKHFQLGTIRPIKSST